MQFDPNTYETVKERKKRFYADHPDGRIVPKKVYITEEHACFEVYVYLNKEDQLNNLPKATGHGFEMRDKELSVTAYGKKYESVNYSSWTENCEESAVGRALDNAGYSNNKCSKEEMEKAARISSVSQKPRPHQINNLTVTQASEELSKSLDTTQEERISLINAITTCMNSRGETFEQVKDMMRHFFNKESSPQLTIDELRKLKTEYTK